LSGLPWDRAVLVVGGRAFNRCRKDSRPYRIHQARSKIIDVESNAAHKDHPDDITQAY